MFVASLSAIPFFPYQGVNLFIVMETIRENLQHMTTSKPKPYQRDWEGYHPSEGEGEREMGETDRGGRDGENGQHSTTSNHTPHIRKMDEGGGRLQFIPSSTRKLFVSKCLSLLHLILKLFHSFSGSQSFFSHLSPSLVIHLWHLLSISPLYSLFVVCFSFSFHKPNSLWPPT